MTTSFERMYSCGTIPRGDGKEALEGHRRFGQSSLYGGTFVDNLEVAMTYAQLRSLISEIPPL